MGGTGHLNLKMVQKYLCFLPFEQSFNFGLKLFKMGPNIQTRLAWILLLSGSILSYTLGGCQRVCLVEAKVDREKNTAESKLTCGAGWVDG